VPEIHTPKLETMKKVIAPIKLKNNY